MAAVCEAQTIQGSRRRKKTSGALQGGNQGVNFATVLKSAQGTDDALWRSIPTTLSAQTSDSPEPLGVDGWLRYGLLGQQIGLPRGDFGHGRARHGGGDAPCGR